jgi:hypothetical protein
MLCNFVKISLTSLNLCNRIRYPWVKKKLDPGSATLIKIYRSKLLFFCGKININKLCRVSALLYPEEWPPQVLVIVFIKRILVFFTVNTHILILTRLSPFCICFVLNNGFNMIGLPKYNSATGKGGAVPVLGKT